MNRHLTDPTQINCTAPRAAQAALRTLLDPADIRGSHVRCTMGEPTPTRWRIWAVTQGRLASVTIAYGELNYCLEEENERLKPGGIQKPIEISSVEAWVKPLWRVVSFGFTGLWSRLDGFTLSGAGDFGVHGLDLAFADGPTIHIDGIVGGDEPVHERWKEFVNAIREGLPFSP